MKAFCFEAIKQLKITLGLDKMPNDRHLKKIEAFLKIVASNCDVDCNTYILCMEQSKIRHVTFARIDLHSVSQVHIFEHRNINSPSS